MDIVTLLWNWVLVNPMANALVLLNNALFGSFGLAIIIFTVFMRGITFPLTLRQLRSSRAMSAMSGRLQEIQKKHKDPKRRSEETMKIYREAGVNPLGCLLPMVAQLPIWFALYSVLRLTVGDVPESTISLSQHLYPWSFIQHAVPLSNKFVGLNLGQPNVILAVLTGATMFVQQKMTTPPAMDEKSASMNSTMLWMMPLMFTYFAISFPSGLALYWVVSSVVSIVLQYVYVGAGGLTWRNLFSLQPVPASKSAASKVAPEAQKAEPEEEEDEDTEAAEGIADERRYRKRSRRGKRRRKR
ncbi:MAG TPA: YidC/Oxa1 family membrane protein insertase [Dehalococcoidia bacterium]|nr:YidC/Oxa1 family membrane protein insertase [Dehalococcoidia bacterium]